MERIEDLRQTPGPMPNGLQAATDGMSVGYMAVFSTYNPQTTIQVK